MFAFAKRCLTSRWLTPALAILFAALLAPTLASGLIVDDFGIRAEALRLGDAARRAASPFDVFRFADADPARRIARIDAGGPWWASPSLRVAFFRPLASASHWVDFHIFARWPLVMHVENVALAVGIIFVWRTTYARLLRSTDSGGAWVAGLAAVFFAINPGLAFAASWIATRNSLLAALFGALALLAQDRSRRDGWRPGGLLAPLAFAASLSAGEAGLGTFALLVAHAVVLDPAPWRRRAVAFAPHVGVFLAWATLYRALGNGTAHSAMYVDPIHDPVAYVRGALIAAPFNLGGELGAVPPGFFVLIAARLLPGMAALGAIFVGIAAWTAWPLLRRDPAARFFGLGALLAVVPVSATIPNDRNLLFVTACLYALSAQLVGLAFDSRSRARRAYAIYTLFLHIIAGVPATLLAAMGMVTVGRFSNAPLAWVRADESIRDRTVVIVNPPAWLFVYPLVWGNLATPQPVPTHVHVVAPGIVDLTVRRTAERELRIHIDGGMLPPSGTWPAAQGPAPALKYEYLSQQITNLVRGTDDPVPVGDVVAASGMRIEVIGATPEGGPTDIVVTFDRPLEDDALRWFAWQGGGYVRFVPPEIGQQTTLTALSMTP
jgi:hypothetical protein